MNITEFFPMKKRCTPPASSAAHSNVQRLNKLGSLRKTPRRLAAINCSFSDVEITWDCKSPSPTQGRIKRRKNHHDKADNISELVNKLDQQNPGFTSPPSLIDVWNKSDQMTTPVVSKKRNSSARFPLRRSSRKSSKFLELKRLAKELETIEPSQKEVIPHHEEKTETSEAVDFTEDFCDDNLFDQWDDDDLLFDIPEGNEELCEPKCASNVENHAVPEHTLANIEEKHKNGKVIDNPSTGNSLQSCSVTAAHRKTINPVNVTSVNKQKAFLRSDNHVNKTDKQVNNSNGFHKTLPNNFTGPSTSKTSIDKISTGTTEKLKTAAHTTVFSSLGKSCTSSNSLQNISTNNPTSKQNPSLSSTNARSSNGSSMQRLLKGAHKFHGSLQEKPNEQHAVVKESPEQTQVLSNTQILESSSKSSVVSRNSPDTEHVSDLVTEMWDLYDDDDDDLILSTVNMETYTAMDVASDNSTSCAEKMTNTSCVEISKKGESGSRDLEIKKYKFKSPKQYSNNDLSLGASKEAVSPKCERSTKPVNTAARNSSLTAVKNLAASKYGSGAVQTSRIQSNASIKTEMNKTSNTRNANKGDLSMLAKNTAPSNSMSVKANGSTNVNTAKQRSATHNSLICTQEDIERKRQLAMERRKQRMAPPKQQVPQTHSKDVNNHKQQVAQTHSNVNNPKQQIVQTHSKTGNIPKQQVLQTHSKDINNPKQQVPQTCFKDVINPKQQVQQTHSKDVNNRTQQVPQTLSKDVNNNTAGQTNRKWRFTNRK